MDVFDDLRAEQDRLDNILGSLDDASWAAPSAAAGWTVKDTVLHMAQMQEMTQLTAADPAADMIPSLDGATVEFLVEVLLRWERPAPVATVYERWRVARERATPGLQSADPQRRLRWVVTPIKPATLATTQLAEHWAHGLDITGPLGIDFPDTARLRHIAWLAHRTVPYALALEGMPPLEVRCELTAPDGAEVWTFGPPDAETTVTGSAGAFCRVAAHRLDPAESGLVVTGPRGDAVLKTLRTYAR
jgi:uncharacterized protein (TIGR03084 family)